MASVGNTAQLVVDRSRRVPLRLDWYLLLGCLALLSFGLLAQFSKAYGTPSRDFQKQVFNIVVGLIPMVMLWVIKPKFWMRIANGLYLINLSLLALVLAIGVTRNGAERWINLGFTDFQPSEAAKLLTILTLATFFAKRYDQINRFSTFGLSFLHVIVPVALIFKQPHMGACLAIMATWLCICLAAQVPIKFVVATAASIVLLFAVAIKVPAIGGLVLKDYHLQRFNSMVVKDAKGESFQTDRAAMALGAGGLVGTGFLKGEQKKLNMIPMQNTDFVITIIGEEGGLVGATLVLITFGFFFYRIWLIYLFATEPYYRMIAVGILSMLAFHTIVNLGMVLQLMPVVGLWLPFLSYGGTAMWLCLASVGLLLNIRSKEKPVLFEMGVK